MIRVNVKNENGILSWSSTFENETDADAWISQESANGSWGEVYEVEKLDVTADLQQKEALDAAKARQLIGADVLAKLAVLNAAKNMDQNALLQLLADTEAAIIERLLWGGALGTAKTMIQAYTGSLYDEADKAALIKMIDDSGLA